MFFYLKKSNYNVVPPIKSPCSNFVIPTQGKWSKHVAESQFRFSQGREAPSSERRLEAGKIKTMKKTIRDFLQSNLQMAKAIRQAIRDKKLPLLAECFTDKSYKDGKGSKQ